MKKCIEVIKIIEGWFVGEREAQFYLNFPTYSLEYYSFSWMKFLFYVEFIIYRSPHPQKKRSL